MAFLRKDPNIVNSEKQTVFHAVTGVINIVIVKIIKQ